MLPTTNIIQKTFLVKRDNSTGTMFAVEHDGREYLVTARHVVPDGREAITVLHDEQWKRLPISGIYPHPGNADVTVMTLDRQIAPRYGTELGLAGATVGQNALLIGFPFDWNNTQFDFNNGYPIPFVKAGIISAFTFRNGSKTIHLDGHSNGGFSGGPIITDHNPSRDPKVGPKIIGVVSAANLEHTPHPYAFNPPLERMGEHPIPIDHVHPTNAGFIKGCAIDHAVELIHDNPTGFQLSS